MAATLRLDPPQRVVRAQYGVAGDWLAALPALATRMLRDWELTAERVAEPGGRSSVTVLVRRADGERAALKLCLPGAAAYEDAALRRWDGRGAVRVLRSAPEVGALLLERLHGETSLRALPEAKAILEAVETAHRLWVDPGAGHPFPTVAEVTAGQAVALREAALSAEVASLVAPLVEEALSLRESLVAGGGGGDGQAPPDGERPDEERRLLHGDFRQGAVLASDAERAPWLAVGPEPLVGERAYDLARLVRDRLHDLVASPGAAAMTRRRVARLADLVEVDAERLRAWSHFRAVASGVRALTEGRREDGEMLLEFASWL
ncbi:aminoglycoside phosphotransferase family protein [Streptomyces sp. 4N509B]|uniref:aminoglycoside phosphotransferase family protein n=1 Tax=Streptomyces sp. 4N509B TaxID=3457413 RepID=UPI003FD21261